MTRRGAGAARMQGRVSRRQADGPLVGGERDAGVALKVGLVGEETGDERAEEIPRGGEAEGRRDQGGRRELKAVLEPHRRNTSAHGEQGDGGRRHQPRGGESEPPGGAVLRALPEPGEDEGDAHRCGDEVSPRGLRLVLMQAGRCRDHARHDRQQCRRAGHAEAEQILRVVGRRDRGEDGQPRALAPLAPAARGEKQRAGQQQVGDATGQPLRRQRVQEVVVARVGIKPHSISQYSAFRLNGYASRNVSSPLPVPGALRNISQADFQITRRPGDDACCCTRRTTACFRPPPGRDQAARPTASAAKSTSAQPRRLAARQPTASTTPTTTPANHAARDRLITTTAAIISASSPAATAPRLPPLDRAAEEPGDGRQGHDDKPGEVVRVALRAGGRSQPEKPEVCSHATGSPPSD